jgi:hypothetical protein
LQRLFTGSSEYLVLRIAYRPQQRDSSIFFRDKLCINDAHQHREKGATAKEPPPLPKQAPAPKQATDWWRFVRNRPRPQQQRLLRNRTSRTTYVFLLN